MKLIRKIVIGLSIAGLFDAGYLTYYKLSSSVELICGETGGCDYVNTSPYSEILGIPVALFGLIYFGAVLVFTLLGRKSFVFVFSAAALLFSFYLTYVEIYILDAICVWCVISASVTLLIFVFSSPGIRWHEQACEPSFSRGD